MLLKRKSPGGIAGGMKIDREPWSVAPRHHTDGDDRPGGADRAESSIPDSPRTRSSQAISAARISSKYACRL